MEGMVLDIARDALSTVILVSAPMLLVALVVGLIISIIQATTQIQEQTLMFVPKILAVFFSILVFGSWMLRLLIEFIQRLYASIPQFLQLPSYNFV